MIMKTWIQIEIVQTNALTWVFCGGNGCPGNQVTRVQTENKAGA